MSMEQVFDREWQAVRRGLARGWITGEEARKRRAALLCLREITWINRRKART